MVTSGSRGLVRTAPILPVIPKQLAMQLLGSLAPSTLLDTKEHIQVLERIQGGRKLLDRDKLSLHIKVGLLKQKSGKGQY